MIFAVSSDLEQPTPPAPKPPAGAEIPPPKPGFRPAAWSLRLIGILALAGMAAGYARWQHPGDLLSAQVANFARTKERVVALTFDDGPHPIITALLLDTLRRYHAHVTFFNVGTKVEQAPGLLRRMRADGHEVESHTYSHDNLDKLSENEIRREIEYADRNIFNVTGIHPRFVRPPGGEYDGRSLAIFSRLHRIFALWSVNPGDWQSPPPDTIVDRVLKQVKPGTIVLLHDDSLNTVHALPTILESLRQQHYRLVTLEELDLMDRGTR